MPENLESRSTETHGCTDKSRKRNVGRDPLVERGIGDGVQCTCGGLDNMSRGTTGMFLGLLLRTLGIVSIEKRDQAEVCAVGIWEWAGICRVSVRLVGVVICCAQRKSNIFCGGLFAQQVRDITVTLPLYSQIGILK